MCGIVYVQRKDGKSAVKQVLKRYAAQKSRGSEGFGYIGIKQSGNATRENRFMFEHEVKTALENTKLGTILFHHRYPTSTPNVPESAHPIRVSHAELQYDYSVVHNGVISNDEELKEAHEKLGYKYSTEMVLQYRTRKGHVFNDGIQWNDSEGLAIELARNIEGLSDKTDAKGAIAYIVLQIERQSQRVVAMYYGTNGGNPLTVTETKEFICIASQGGKAINDNICYRVSMPDNTISDYPQVQLHPAWQPKQSGYLSHVDTRTVGNPRMWDQGPREDEYVGRVPHRAAEDKDLVELQDEIADLEEELIGLSGDIEYALEGGDMEEEEMYRNQFAETLARKDKLNRLYLVKANAKASTAQ